MIKCCGTLNTGFCPIHHPNIVSFDNLKTKYLLNADIQVEYTLHGDVQQASTRDWLGIFPKGWTNLQQYLTFEYAIVAPRAASSSNRTIIFPRVFHQEASTNIEYQFVYVSREIQVLATSSYFRFIRSDEIDPAIHVLLKLPHYEAVRASPSEKLKEIHSDQLFSSEWSPPHIVLSDQSLLSLRSSKTIPANPRLPRICKGCGRPSDNACGLAVGRARFLATHNASLAERVIRLERELLLAKNTKCNLSERLEAYEKFVKELLGSLAMKQIVKIIDSSGTEILLQQLLPIVEDPEVKIIDKSKEDLSTNDRASVDENLLENDKLSINDEKTVEEFTVVEKKLFNVDMETQTEDGIDVADGCSEEHKMQEIVGESETLESNVTEPNVQEGGIDEDNRTADNCETEKLEDGSKTLQSKPSAIVIQGSNIKFAIIRY